MINLWNKFCDIDFVRFLTRLYKNIQEDYIGLLAAGIAFYFFLGSFPAIAALISLYGLYSDPYFIAQQIELLEDFLPEASLKILFNQAESIASSNNAALSIGFVIGTILTIYSAMKGVRALIQGLNVAYNLRERRNIIRVNAACFTLTFIMMLYLILALSLVAFMPALFNILHIPTYITDPLLASRWPLLSFGAVIGLQILYYFAPSHEKPQWRWFSWGAFTATILWLVGSSFFSLFVSNFGNYNETYGSLGAVAVLLLWFWLSGLTVLFGAEINCALSEHRRAKEIIEDPPQD
jgi:membrane protein